MSAQLSAARRIPVWRSCLNSRQRPPTADREVYAASQHVSNLTMAALSSRGPQPMISREANLPRKAMRVAIPLFVEIEGRNHAARDWSTTGVGIGDLERVPAEGELLSARLSFPMLESTLLIPVQLVYRGEHDGVAGFEFHDLSARNRRILRHYIELSLDGKLGDVDDIVAVAALPAAETPVHAPLTLQGASRVLPGGSKTRAFGAV